MLCREVIAVYSKIHTKHIITLCGQNVEFFIIKPGSTLNIRFYLLHYDLFGYCWRSTFPASDRQELSLLLIGDRGLDVKCCLWRRDLQVMETGGVRLLHGQTLCWSLRWLVQLLLLLLLMVRNGSSERIEILQLTATDSQQDHENGRQHELWRENRDCMLVTKLHGVYWWESSLQECNRRSTALDCHAVSIMSPTGDAMHV